MAEGDNVQLGEQILGQFLEDLEDNADISKEVSGVIKDLSDKDDFGGRDQIEERVLEAKEINAD